MSVTHYERWIWIELIGFDNEQEDFGIASWLNKMHFIPHSVSLLLYSPDFVHQHVDMSRERALPIECCSYLARPKSRERLRQQWTNFQLRQLVQRLQSYQIDVYCSFFDMYSYRQDDGRFAQSKWCEQYAYLSEMRSNGETIHCIHPLKRFRDGSYYEDFFISKLGKVMDDYQFNGYHGADGYSSTRISLADSDYSDDLVEQFVHAGNYEVADHISLSCEGSRAEIEKRSAWIWAHRRQEWIQFHINRWEKFWRKIVAALHGNGQKAIFNTAWTRDPFEAVYRYGIDYKRIAGTGVDAFIVESVTSSLTLGAAGVEMDPHHDFMAMLMLIKAYVPETKLVCLNSIQDTTEQWDTLRHAPAVLERDMYSLSNVYHFHKGQLQRCSAGFVACLADGIREHEWKWIRERWDLGFESSPERLLAATLVWSDTAMDNQLQDYIHTRNCSVHKFTHELMFRGAAIRQTVHIRDLNDAQGAIVMFNSHLWQDSELQMIAAYTKGSVIVIGPKMPALFEEFVVAADHASGHPWQCAILHGAKSEQNSGNGLTSIKRYDAEMEAQVMFQQDPGSWVHSLPYRTPSDEFLTVCADLVKQYSDQPTAVNQEDGIHLTAMIVQEGQYRLMIGNDCLNYAHVQVDMKRPVLAAEARSDYPVMPIEVHNQFIYVKVPGRGVVVADIVFVMSD